MGIEHTGDPSRSPDIYNSAALIAPKGAWIQRYDKIHLVPFGEYIPFEKLIVFAKKLTREIGTFARGTQRNPSKRRRRQARNFHLLRICLS